MKKVFISYSHKDENWKDRLMPHLRTLEQQGDIVLWDDRKIGGGEDWYPAIENELQDAAVAICLISADYLASNFINKEEIPELKLRRSRDGMLLLPVLVRPCPWNKVQWLKGIQMLPGDGKALAEIRGKVNQEKSLSEVAEYVYDKINDPTFQIAAPAPKWKPPEKIDIDRLPQTGTQLFGRQKELELLDETWESDETRIVSFVAWGGVGKSALVNKWIDLMSKDNYRGAQRVYAWSFYSQGTGERVTSSDVFVNKSLHWFGDSKMADSERSPWDKGVRLAELVRKQRTLLILDGMEPLQSAYEHDRGEVKDAALGVLLRELAKKNCGLCVITTREELTGIRKGVDSILQKRLDQISAEAGRALLRVGGIHGTDAELEQITRDFGNHALAVNLLVAYLQDIPGKHVRNARFIPDLGISEKKGKHPRRVMEALAKNLGDSPELNVLHMIGLFDRPATEKEIRWLRTREEVPDLTDRIRWLDEEDWNRVVANLRRLRLIAGESHHNIGGLDAHPHVREHFGQKLKETNEESWKLGHSHLYEFLKMSAPRLPKTLEEMRPLFLAVAHGCQAGNHQETLDDVYYPRVQRSGEINYCCSQLGAFGADLAALACFFEEPWSKPAPTLLEKDKPAVLNWAGFRLRALGRLTEAAEPTKAAVAGVVEKKDWRNAASGAGTLSELHLTLGDVKKALDCARQSVDYADKSGDEFQRLVRRCNWANALHQAGELVETRKLFETAEEIQKKSQPEYPYAYSARGFWSRDLLLSGGQYKEVQKRASQTLEWSTQKKFLLDIGLDKLSLGRAYLMEARMEKTDDYTKAADFLNQAVDGLRQASHQEFIARGLLARAELHRYQRSWEKAWGDLEEAKEIAERGEMNLYMADYHLEAARLCLAQGRGPDGREHWKEAKERVEKMGYHRRDPEVMLIEAELEIEEGKKKAAKQTLKKAKECIDKMGCHRWDIELEELQGRLK